MSDSMQEIGMFFVERGLQFIQLHINSIQLLLHEVETVKCRLVSNLMVEVSPFVFKKFSISSGVTDAFRTMLYSL